MFEDSNFCFLACVSRHTCTELRSQRTKTCHEELAGELPVDLRLWNYRIVTNVTFVDCRSGSKLQHGISAFCKGVLEDQLLQPSATVLTHTEIEVCGGPHRWPHPLPEAPEMAHNNLLIRMSISNALQDPQGGSMRLTHLLKGGVYRLMLERCRMRRSTEGEHWRTRLPGSHCGNHGNSHNVTSCDRYRQFHR